MPPIHAPPAQHPLRRNDISNQLEAMLRNTANGAAHLAAIYGDAGHGKTTMLADLIEYANDHGHLVVSMRGDSPDGEIPYAGLHSLISRNIGLLDRFDSPSTRLLHRVLLDFTPPDSVLSMCAAVTAWLECLTSSLPMLVTVDDADLVDEESLRVLAFVSTRQDDGRALIVLSASSPVPLFERLDARRFVLDDLEEPQALQLVREMGTSGDTARRLTRRLGGNPLALTRVGAQVASGEVTLADDVPIAIPMRLENDVRQRIEGMTPESRHMLDVAAVTDSCRVADLEEWANSSGHLSVDGMLSDAEEAGILRSEGNEVTWRRPWMLEAILRRCPEGRRRRLRDELRSTHRARESVAAVARLSVLTPSEMKVVNAIVEGMSTREAARELSLSVKTIESHVQNIYRKVDVRSRSQLTALALREPADPHGSVRTR